MSLLTCFSPVPSAVTGSNQQEGYLLDPGSRCSSAKVAVAALQLKCDEGRILNQPLLSRHEKRRLEAGQRRLPYDCGKVELHTL